MSYRYDVSYPFLDVARRHGADYGDVLMAARMLGDESILDPAGNPVGRLAIDAMGRLPVAARKEIANLCALPVHERGGRTDVCDECGLEVRASIRTRDWRATCPMPHVRSIPDRCLLVEMEKSAGESFYRAHQC